MSRTLFVFLFAVVGANLFLGPIEYLLVHLGPLVAVVFSIVWIMAWVAVKVKYRFYTTHILAYATGSGVGTVLNLMYVAPLFGVF